MTDPHLRAQALATLTALVLAWPKLPPEFRTAIQALTQSAPT